MSSRAPQKGFTLIELLVVIAIIGTLASVVLASLNSAREKATASAMASELREIEKAFIAAATVEGLSSLWPESLLGGGNPSLETVLSDPQGSEIANFLPTAPEPDVGTAYVYDQDGDSSNNCGAIFNGANIIIYNAAETRENLDEIFDNSDGGNCGKIRWSSSNNHVFFRLANDPDSF